MFFRLFFIIFIPTHSLILHYKYFYNSLKLNIHQKAEKELDYHPMSVKQSITDMVQWIRENEKKSK